MKPGAQTPVTPAKKKKKKKNPPINLKNLFKAVGISYLHSNKPINLQQSPKILCLPLTK
jgi:hypothetical protein